MDYLHNLTIGQASGLVAVGVFIISCTAPLLICVLILRWHGRELTAATWSVIDRQLQSTLWPTLFNSDSVATRHVDPWITCLVYLRILLSILIVMAGVITPLGFGDTVVAVGKRSLSFEYIPDLSPFGRNMQERSNLPISRNCIGIGYQCPGAIVPGAFRRYNNKTYEYDSNGIATTKIPENMTAMFSSATDGTTVAGFFDIQYRFWKRANNSYYNNNEPFLRGVPRAVDNLILRENLTAVEGLIVDMETGGIGIRNHTVPVNLDDKGVDWQEDILWLTPDYACESLNMSFQGVIAIDDKTYGSAFSQLNLTDDGALANLQPGTPYKDWPIINTTWPDVRMRVRRSARLHNTLVAMALNLTTPKLINSTLNTSIGRSWPLDQGYSGAEGVNPLAVGAPSLYSEVSLFRLPSVSYNSTIDTLSMYNSSLNKTVYFRPARDYPFLFTSVLFRELESRCNGNGDDFTVNRYRNVECSLFLEPPTRVDKGSPLEHEGGSKWKFPMRLCAGAVKASIKTVAFSRNKTSTLSGLIVRNISDKTYSSPQQYPIWAMEDWTRNGSEGAFLAPIWGLVSDSYSSTPGYNFTRSPEYYLPYSNPAITWTGLSGGAMDSLAGGVVPYGALKQVFSAAFKENNGYGQTLARYSGSDSAALSQKWQDLSQNDRGVERILRLVWTNIVAGSITSSRGRTSSAFHNSDGTIANRVAAQALQSDTVRIYQRRITYDWRFGAPALALIALWLGLWGISVLFAFICRIRPSHMKHMLRDTSLGRHAARQADASTGRFNAVSTSQWLRKAGHVKIPLGHSRQGSIVTINKGDPRGHYELTRIHEEPKSEEAGDYRTARVYKASSLSSVSSSTYHLLNNDTAYNRQQ